MSYIQSSAVFSLKFEKKNGYEYEPERVLVGLSFEKLWYLGDREFSNSRQHREAKARELRAQDYGKQKKCLSCFKRSKRRIPLELRFGNKSTVIHNILVCLSLRIIT